MFQELASTPAQSQLCCVQLPVELRRSIANSLASHCQKPITTSVVHSLHYNLTPFVSAQEPARQRPVAFAACTSPTAVAYNNTRGEKSRLALGLKGRIDVTQSRLENSSSCALIFELRTGHTSVETGCHDILVSSQECSGATAQCLRGGFGFVVPEPTV